MYHVLEYCPTLKNLYHKCLNFKREALLNWFIKDHGGEQGSTRFQGSEIQGSETSEIAEDLTASLLEYIKTTSEGGGGDHTKYRLPFMRLMKIILSIKPKADDIFVWSDLIPFYTNLLELFNELIS